MANKDYSLAMQVAKELAQYIYPKRKAVEHVTEQDLEPMQITIRYVDADDNPKPMTSLK